MNPNREHIRLARQLSDQLCSMGASSLGAFGSFLRRSHGPVDDLDIAFQCRDLAHARIIASRLSACPVVKRIVIDDYQSPCAIHGDGFLDIILLASKKATMIFLAHDDKDVLPLDKLHSCFPNSLSREKAA